MKNRNLILHLTILLAVFAVVIIVNFPVGAWFTGWDNLHPEFNFWLNIKRGLSSVWQENQGLGTYGGHGYAATLPHTIAIWLMSILVPAQYLRSTFTFLMLGVGSVGVFFLLRKLLEGKNEDLKNKSSLIAALFYMLNFATTQNFYIQLEAFIIHFAALPWLFLTLINFLQQSSKKNLLVFTIVSLITTTQGFIPPLFFVYALLLGIFLLFYVMRITKILPIRTNTTNNLIFSKRGVAEVEGHPGSAHASGFAEGEEASGALTGGKLLTGPQVEGTQPLNTKSRLKNAILIAVITIAVNAYWFLPVAYYTFTRSSTYINAYNNLSSTEDFILKNKKYGNLPDMILLKGFISEAIDASENGTVFYIFNDWQKHLSKPAVQAVSYLLFAIIILGALGLLKEKFYHKAFLAGFILVFSLMCTDTFPFSTLSDLLQKIPVFKQAFRVAFTKFSISMAFFYAISLGIGLYILLSFIAKFLSRAIGRIPEMIIFLLLMTGLVYLSLPIFTGNFLYTRTKLAIPHSYFELMDFFSKQDKKQRIANLPQGWNWGWSVYRWGYSGSGFLWYGIEQPIMDRSFDSWGKYNENYYWEISYAIYSENFPLLEKIMDKYQINWLILDTNIIPYLNSRGILYSHNLEDYLQTAEKFKLVKTINSSQENVRDIKIYQIKLSPSRSSLQDKPFGHLEGVNRDRNIEIFNTDDLYNIGSVYNFTNYDRAFERFGNYYTSNKKPIDVYYPFRTLLTNRKPDELPVKISKKDQSIEFESPIPQASQEFVLQLPLINEEYYQLNPQWSIKDHKLAVTVPKDSEVSYDSKNDPYFLDHDPSDCNSLSILPGLIRSQTFTNNSVQFTSLESENCYDIILAKLSQRSAYLVRIESAHKLGKRLQFAVINQDSRKADIEFPLGYEASANYAIVPPMKHYGMGYSLHFNNISIGNTKTINELKRITLYPIPFDFLTSMILINPAVGQNRTDGKLLTYFQSYDTGWKAYQTNFQFSIFNFQLAEAFPFLFGKELKEHVLVNNWANGWLIDNFQLSTFNSQLIVIFWPQYLEWIGFFLLAATPILIFLHKKI